MEPIPALDVSEIHFEETTDVAVVGLGVAGASAVLGARQKERTFWPWNGAADPAERRPSPAA